MSNRRKDTAVNSIALLYQGVKQYVLTGLTCFVAGGLSDSVPRTSVPF
jgi:hypothetical protein